MGPINNLNYLIQHIASVINKQADQVLQEQLGIGVSQYKILSVLEWSPRVQQKAIAKALGQTEASISRQISLLYKQQLVNKVVDMRNRRARLIKLTNKGLTLLEAADKIIRKFHNEQLSSLSNKKKSELYELLFELHTSICRHDYSITGTYIDYISD